MNISTYIPCSIAGDKLPSPSSISSWVSLLLLLLLSVDNNEGAAVIPTPPPKPSVPIVIPVVAAVVPVEVRSSDVVDDDDDDDEVENVEVTGTVTCDSMSLKYSPAIMTARSGSKALNRA